LRIAAQDPKAGSVSFLGAPTGAMYKDWLFEGDWLVTRDFGPILLRFVADTIDVPKMKDLFCEGLAARIGMEVCEPLTQSITKDQFLQQTYKWAISRAKTANAIEAGPEEPPEDDWVTTRM